MTSQSVWPSWENQVGLFLKIPSDNFSFHSCPNIWWLFGALSRSHYLSSFWGVIGLLFIPSSGHTGDCHEPQQIPSQLKQNDVIYYTWQKMLQPQQIPSQPKQKTSYNTRDKRRFNHNKWVIQRGVGIQRDSNLIPGMCEISRGG